METQTPPPTPSAEEVRDFIAGTPAVAPVELRIKPEDLGSAPAPEPVGPKTPVLPADQTFAKDAGAQSDVAEKLLITSSFEFKLAEIEPTMLEKETFLEAVVLEDAPVLLKFKLPGWKLDFQVRTRNNVEQTAIFQALDYEQKQDKILNTGHFLTRMQYYVAAFQLVAMGDRMYPMLKLPDNATPEQASTILSAYVAQNFEKMPVPKWQLIVAAMRFFDLKIAFLTNALIRPEDFSKPAG